MTTGPKSSGGLCFFFSFFLLGIWRGVVKGVTVLFGWRVPIKGTPCGVGSFLSLPGSGVFFGITYSESAWGVQVFGFLLKHAWGSRCFCFFG